MKPSLLVGIALAIVILAAGVAGPLVLSTAGRGVAAAREQALLAERQLHRYDFMLPHVGRMIDMATMDAVDLDLIAGRAQENLQSISQAISREISEARRQAEAAGVEPSNLQALPPSAAGVRQALTGFRKDLQENQQRLTAALGTAREASQAAPGASILAPLVTGLTEFTNAAVALAEARDLRREQRALQSKLMRLAMQWAVSGADQDYLAGLDVQEILSDLRADLEEVEALKAEADQRVSELQSAVEQQQAKLAEARTQREQASQALLEHERQGFTLGDAAAFNEYRARYEELSSQLNQAEQEEMLLESGGYRGATLTGGDWTTDELTGGEPVTGLEQLQRELTVAQERADRLAQAQTALEQHLQFVQKAGASAKQGEDRYVELRDEIERQQQAILPEPLLGMVRDATEKEDAALQAARRAAAAFGAAQQAMDQWVSAAREAQSERDPERANERLRMILENPANAYIGAAAQAAAQLLVGRIFAQRIAANEALLSDMRVLMEMRPDVNFDAAVFSEQVITARENGLEVLKNAASIYERIENRAAAPTKWIPQIGRATANYLMALVDAGQSTQYLAQAAQLVSTAVQGKERSPFVQRHMDFHDHLRKLAGVTTPPEGEEATPAETPGEGAGGEGGEG